VLCVIAQPTNVAVTSARLLATRPEATTTTFIECRSMSASARNRAAGKATCATKAVMPASALSSMSFEALRP